MVTALTKASQSNHLINSLIPITVALHLSKATREIGLIALFLWIVLQLWSGLQVMRRHNAAREAWLPWTLILGFFLFNSRNIILRDDYHGPITFLIIGTGLLLGSQFNERQWRELMSWIAISIAPAAIYFASQLAIKGDWTFNSFFDTYYELVKPSIGSINRLATLSTFQTLAAWYSSTLSRMRWSQAGHLLLAAIGYWIVLGTDSRMAISAVPIAILLPWLAFRLHRRLNRNLVIISLLSTTTFVAFWAWELVIKSWFFTSDVMRLRMATCWIRKGMLSSLKHFWMGSGYNTDQLREACEFIRPGDSFGHAHNTIAHIAGNHGLLGLIGLFAVTALVAHGLWRQRPTNDKQLAWSPWRSTSWAEISFGFNFALLFCALSTTVQIASPVNQLLIGLMAGSACLNASVDVSPPMPDEVNT